jgi:hypothetical protein
MKTFIVAAMLLTLSSTAHAITCTGRVKIDVADGHGLGIKGDKVLSVGACDFGNLALEKRVLHTCPLGSWCRIEGSYSGDADIETIDSVARIHPYQEGMRDYRAGQCYRARPYADHSPEQKLWERGYDAHPTKKIAKRNDEICFPGRDIKEKH